MEGESQRPFPETPTPKSSPGRNCSQSSHPADVPGVPHKTQPSVLLSAGVSSCAVTVLNSPSLEGKIIMYKTFIII